MKNVVLIVSVNSAYEDVAAVFCELLKKNWSDCPFEVVFSTNKELDILLPGKVEVYEDGSSLPNNIRNIVDKYHADYAICLLGDAFISDYIKTDEILRLLEELEENSIDYCKLYCRKYSNKKGMYRKVLENEFYIVSFIAFIASRRFINREFINNISDYELESKYLKLVSEGKKGLLQEKFVQVEYNFFHLIHGVSKGKWIHSSKKRLDKISNMIKKSNRPMVSCKDTICIEVYGVISRLLKPKNRKFLKRILMKIGFKFITDY